MSIEPDMREVLALARVGSMTVKSDAARRLAESLAEAASRGWVSTQIGREAFGRLWLLTPAGAAVYQWLIEEM